MSDKLYNLVLWSDSINQASYSQLALRLIFGFDGADAQRHIEEITAAGQSVLACDALERIEPHLCALRRFGLPATIEVPR